MATYYVRTDGSDSNTGTGPATNQAWQTITKAIGTTGITSGDTLYIAPGTYRGNFTVTATAFTSATYIIGDVTASQFSGVTAGSVRLTSRSSDSVAISGTTFTGNNKPFLNISCIYFDGGVSIIPANNLVVEKCLFVGYNSSPAIVTGCTTGATTRNIFRKNIVLSGNTNSPGSHAGYNVGDEVANQGTNISDCLFISGCFNVGLYPTVNNVNMIISNCTFSGYAKTHVRTAGTVTSAATVQNCLFVNGGAIDAVLWSQVSNQITEDYNRILMPGTARTNVATGTNTVNNGWEGLDFGQALLMGYDYIQMYTALAGSPNIDFGRSANAPASDIYGVTWTGATPDVGAVTYRSLSTVGNYNPTERNASTITITPGSTSQSIELYLGATGLTASTAGLSAYYNRTRSADVQIPLVARTVTQAWTSGGFAEVNPNTMPGVYRLDLPDAAVSAGADDVTVVVRGASGTNGAVISIKLSSGGLTSAQTAQAVWDADTTSHTTHGTYGWNVLRADQTSKQGLVGLHQVNNNNRVDADVHAIVNDETAATYLKGALNHDGTGYVDADVVRISTSTAAADELEGALLHNGTDYIDSNLVGGNSTQVFSGRFQLKQTGSEQVDIIEAFTTDTPAFELQLFDADNNLVPVTGATLGLRILDVTSTVVETGTPTIEYGAGGIVRWTAPGSYVSIGCPAGNYRLFIDRTVSGTTTTFGPLQIKVQVQ